MAAQVRNRGRQRPGPFEQTQHRHQDDEETEVVKHEQDTPLLGRTPDEAVLGFAAQRDAAERRRDEEGFTRGLRPDQREDHAGQHEAPERQTVQRPEARGPHRRGVEPRQQEQHAERAAHGEGTQLLTGDHQTEDVQVPGKDLQDRVERQQVPFGNDVGR